MTDIEVARVQVRRVLCIGTPNIPVSHVVDVAVPNAWTRPSLEAASELAIQHPSILNEDVLDDVFLARILANRSHGLTMSACEEKSQD